MELITDIVDILILNKYFKAFLDRKLIMTRNAFYIINFLLVIGMFFVNKLDIYVLNLFYCIGCIALISFNYSGSIKKKGYISLLYTAGGFAAETFGVLLLVGMQRQNIFSLEEETIYQIAICFCELLRILTAFLLLKISGKMNDCSEKIYIWMSGVLIAIIVACICLMHLIVEYSGAALLGAILLFATVGVIFLIIFANREITELVKIGREQQAMLVDVECKEEYYELLKRKQMEIEKIRHNYRNELLGIKGALRKDKKAGEEQIDYLLDAVESTCSKVYTPNFILNTICNHKFDAAEKLGIKIEHDIKVPENIGIDASSLSVLYGNLFDNAIEACLGVPKHQRKIIFFTVYKKKELYIRMENPYTDKAKVYLNKQHKHGIGLQSVREIIQKYDGIYNLTKENGSFKIKICIYAIGD